MPHLKRLQSKISAATNIKHNTVVVCGFDSPAEGFFLATDLNLSNRTTLPQ
jgi:hypothetical protein